MQAKLDAKLQPKVLPVAAASAIEASLDTATLALDVQAGRPHARINPVFSPKEPEATRSDPAA